MKARIGQVWEHCLTPIGKTPLDWNKSAVFKIVNITNDPYISCECKIITDTLHQYSIGRNFFISFEPEDFPNWRLLSSPGWSCVLCKQKFSEIDTIFPHHQELITNN